MQKITSARELKNAIGQLESDQKLQAGLLKETFHRTAESLSPGNLLRSALKKVLTSPLVVMIGIEKVKSYGHWLIDRIFPGRQATSSPD